MSYETIQTALTALINVTAIAGFGGIALHAFWTSHCNWMAEYCPPVAPPNQDAQTLTENLLIEIFQLTGSGEAIAPEPEDIWSMPISTSSPRYWVRSTPPQPPTLYLLPPAKEEVKPAKKSRKTAAKPKTSATPKRKKAARMYTTFKGRSPRPEKSAIALMSTK
jgi:hypothetical protein